MQSFKKSVSKAQNFWLTLVVVLCQHWHNRIQSRHAGIEFHYDAQFELIGEQMLDELQEIGDPLIEISKILGIFIFSDEGKILG